MDCGTALITGGAQRIGRAISLKLADADYAVCIHYHDSDRAAKQLVQTITDKGGRAVAVQGDLSDSAKLQSLFEQARMAFGPVTCLINNASVFDDDEVATLTDTGWRRTMTVNLQAPVFLAKFMSEQLPDAVEGTIVNLIDQRVLAPGPDFFSYSLSKSALFAATRMLAQALAPRVRVNGIGPGPVLQSQYQSPADFAAEVDSTLLKRGVSPEAIAEGVQFLIDASSITGQMIAMDGGQHLTPHPFAHPAKTNPAPE